MERIVKGIKAKQLKIKTVNTNNYYNYIWE